MIDPKFGSRLTEEAYTRLIAGNPCRVTDSGEIRTGAVRLSFPSLHKASKVNPTDPDDKARYYITGLFTHKNIKPMMDTLTAAVRSFYPAVADPRAMLDPKNKLHPLKDQGLKVNVANGGFEPLRKTYGGYVTGYPFFTAKSKRPPGVFHFVNGRVVSCLPEEIEKLFYPGCWVDAKLNVFKSTSANNPGVVVGLQAVIKLADDSSISGGGGANPADFADAMVIEDPNALVALAGEDDPWN